MVHSVYQNTSLELSKTAFRFFFGFSSSLALNQGSVALPISPLKMSQYAAAPHLQCDKHAICFRVGSLPSGDGAKCWSAHTKVDKHAHVSESIRRMGMDRIAEAPCIANRVYIPVNRTKERKSLKKQLSLPRALFLKELVILVLYHELLHLHNSGGSPGEEGICY